MSWPPRVPAVFATAEPPAVLDRLPLCEEPNIL